MDAKADDATDTVTITLHDLYIDRKEALPDETKLDDCLKASEHARKIQVPKGTTLEKALTGNNNVTLGTKSLKATGVYKKEVTPDDHAVTSVANASECVWYTRADSADGNGNGGVDGNNPRKKFGSDTKINDNIDLYTYSYRLRLITAKDTYKDLIVREGQSKGIAYSSDTNTANTDISSFLSSTKVTSWTDVNEKQLVNTTALSNGLTRNYTLRASGMDAPTKEIPCYVAVNGKWTQIYTIQMDTDRVDVWGRTGPALNYYVTDAELKDAYSAYGFGKDVTFEGGITSKDKNGYFPFAYDNKQLQNRQMPKQAEGSTQFRVPLVEDTKDITKNLAIYYTPHSTTGYVTTDDSDVLKNNSFYTISVDKEDKDKFGTSDNLPDTKILSGGNTTVELPSKDKDGNAVTWYVEKGSDVTTISKNDGSDTVTVTVKGINEQVLLTTDQLKAEGLKVHCFVLIDQQPVEIGLLTTTKTQSDTSWGTGKNYTRYYITSAQAETVYKKYGFDASQYAPNTTAAQKYNFAIGFYDKDLTISDNSARMWADIVPINVDGEYKIPMISEEDGKKYGSCSVYYIPNNTEKKDFWTNAMPASAQIWRTISLCWISPARASWAISPFKSWIWNCRFITAWTRMSCKSVSGMSPAAVCRSAAKIRFVCCPVIAACRTRGCLPILTSWSKAISLSLRS